jgi:hypothetical protein
MDTGGDSLRAVISADIGYEVWQDKEVTVGSYRVYNTRTPVYTRKSGWGQPRRRFTRSEFGVADITPILRRINRAGQFTAARHVRIWAKHIDRWMENIDVYAS